MGHDDDPHGPELVGGSSLRWANTRGRRGADSYNPKSGTFIALMTDGTPIRWREAKTGYYVPESFAPVKPDGVLLWGYATAFRLTGEQEHWDMARAIAQSLDLGDLGERAGERTLRLDTDQGRRGKTKEDG